MKDVFDRIRSELLQALVDRVENGSLSPKDADVVYKKMGLILERERRNHAQVTITYYQSLDDSH